MMDKASAQKLIADEAQLRKVIETLFFRFESAAQTLDSISWVKLTNRYYAFKEKDYMALAKQHLTKIANQ